MLSHVFINRGGPTIVLIHGLGSDRHCFDAALTAPAISNKNLLIPDLPGFGDSHDVSESYGLHEAAAQVVQLLEYYKIKNCSVIGHSMGGAIAILLAERFGVTHFVNAVGNLVSEDTLFSRKIAQQDFATFSSNGFQAYKKAIRIGLRKDRPASSYPLSLEKTDARAMYVWSQKLVDITDHGDLLERFIKLKAKKIYLQDEDNPIAPRLAQRLDEAKIVRHTIARTGHVLMEDNPADFYHCVGDFLK